MTTLAPQVKDGGIRCPNCEGGLTSVVDMRRQSAPDWIWRRRKCLDCGARFTTKEERISRAFWLPEKEGRE